jgi:hypothetical protein
MAIFAVRSTKNVNDDNHNTTGSIKSPTPPSPTPRTATEPMTPFDDDKSYFISHFDADPFIEPHSKRRLVESDGDEIIQETTTDDDEEYTYPPF